MKFLTILTVTFSIANVLGFSASPARKIVRPDAANLVEEALKISAAYGLDSKEAAVAWDAVEEVDSSDNRYVVKFTSILLRAFFRI
jgi:CP12 domain